jgi:hypothetical protein
VTGGWRKLHNEELHNLYSSPSIIRMIKSSRILVLESEGKKTLGRTRRRSVGNVKMDLRKIKWDGMDWIDLDQARDQGSSLVNR